MNREELLKTAKPILFNTDMVRAILESRKVVTRRLLKPQPKTIYYDGKVYDDDGLYVIAEKQNGGVEQIELPYRPNDILYVRESFFKDALRYMYKANYSDSEKFFQNGKEVSIKWHPSIHMPKEAARIFLRVIDVWTEQLQEITQIEAVKEGFINDTDLNFGTGASARKHFFEHWDSNIKKSNLHLYGWDANPWVWVIEFERMKVSDNA